MSGRILFVFAGLLLFPGLAQAQSPQEIGQMRLYIQQLEERVRQLTGEVEQLQHELQVTRRQAGIAGPPQSGEDAPMDQSFGWNGGQPGAQPNAQPDGGQQFGAGSNTYGGATYGGATGGSVNPSNNSSSVAGAPPQDLGTVGISPDDPRIAQDGEGGFDAGAPIDLSTLAGGGPEGPAPAVGPVDDMGNGGEQPQGPALASLSGDPRQDYDFAYGYILTGDYSEAERSFAAWLERFPNEAQANDARFWLGESQLQQNKDRAAANTFLELYKTAPKSRKAPDALMKLGIALAALGEKDAACATFDEVGRKYPDASGALTNRVAAEAKRAGC
ncbi:tol-pal system protein YbgF [Afifella sp. JA880]|uniref:tol-pal system protein YbgF n=1 Tax=Afifella sp. JA880 TaxID=2975280 RepID=UPI0021BACF08|nr:tol-pal system protein YbgF [Afifella sp. JA880]MCT8268093.1 tol-pal system protein YbgF [Afifella sp. JA880]